MKSYPRLTEMGVVHPEHIIRYSLSSLDYTDYLNLVYDRPKDSVLPLSKSFRFPRVQESGGAGQEAAFMKTCPELREALDELDDLLDAQTDKRDVASSLREEIQRLEQAIHIHTEHLKALIDKIEPK